MTIARQSEDGIISYKVTIEEIKDFCHREPEIEVDTETTGLDPHDDDILCVQLGTPKVQYLFEWDPVHVPWLQELFSRKDKTFILQNAKFDLQMFYKHGIVFANNIFDTFLAESVLTCGLDYIRKSLDELGKRYLGVDISKDVRSLIPDLGLTHEVVKYGLNDVKYMTLIKQKQEKLLRKRGLTRAARLDNSFVRVLAYIEFCGIGFDPDRWLLKCKADRKGLTNSEHALNEGAIELGDTRFLKYGDLFTGGETQCTINWNSDQQVIPFLQSFGVNTTVFDEGKFKESVAAEVIKPQRHLHPLVAMYSRYAKFAKRVSTFGPAYLEYISPRTNRIHTTYKQIVNTGRMSCGKKGKKGYKSFPNLQQVPKDDVHRGCFVAERGNSLINADYSGQEAVVFANKTMDPALLAFYDKGLGDMHSYVAKLCFRELDNTDLDDVKKQFPDLRQKAKSAGFAIQFGGNGYTIANNLGISQREGDEVYTNYMESFTGIKSYFDKVSAETLSKGYVTFNDITGRKSYISFFKEYQKLKREMADFDWKTYREHKEADTEHFREVLKPKVRKYFGTQGRITRRSYNYPVQGTAADITKTASCIIFDRMIERDLVFRVKFVHIVHDEVVLEAPDGLIEEENLTELVQDGMEKAGKYFYTRVPLKATPVVSKIWEH